MTVAILLSMAVLAYLAAAVLHEKKMTYTRRDMAIQGWELISFILMGMALGFAWIEVAQP